MNTQSPLIELRNVSMDYGSGKDQMLALEEIDLTIAPQDFVCVLGPSGCGKSTLMKIIAGYQQPTTGEAIFQGEPIQGPDWHRGVVFQSPTLYPWLNVKEMSVSVRTSEGWTKRKLIGSAIISLNKSEC